MHPRFAFLVGRLFETNAAAQEGIMEVLHHLTRAELAAMHEAKAGTEGAPVLATGEEEDSLSAEQILALKAVPAALEIEGPPDERVYLVRL